MADLRDIGDFIADDDPEAAERWTLELASVAESSGRMPFRGRIVPEFGREDVRELFRRRYRIAYRIEPNRVVILTLFEGHRPFPDDVAP